MSSDFLQNQPHFGQNCIFSAETGWFGRNWLVLQMVLFGQKSQIFDRTISAEPSAELFCRKNTEIIFGRTLA